MALAGNIQRELLLVKRVNPITNLVIPNNTLLQYQLDSISMKISHVIINIFIKLLILFNFLPSYLNYKVSGLMDWLLYVYR